MYYLHFMLLFSNIKFTLQDFVYSSAPSAPATEPPVLKERIKDEVKDYQKKKVVTQVGSATFDPPQWWGHQAEEFPLLSDIARRIFVIPASSAECERHFSAFNARHIITAQRNNMYTETVQALSIILKGYKNNLI